MNKHLKLITALLSIIFCASVFTLSVSAIDADGDGYDDETGEYIAEVTDPVYTEPVDTEPVYTEPETTVPETAVPETTEPVETDPVYTEPVYNYEDDTNDYDESNDSQSSDSYNDYDFDTDNYDIDYSDEYYQSVAPTSSLYESDRVIDDSELSNNDWDEIKANLSNASSVEDDDSGDFGFIKDNDSSGDNGDWMLFAGLICILLSIAGIIYVIASAVSRRKKMNSGAYTRQPAYAGASGLRYSSDDYNDGYRTPSRSEKKKLDRSRKYDTADVKLPKSNGGRRYR